MKVKLIQSGGFASVKKTAEADLTELPPSLQHKLQLLFTQAKPAITTKSATRDKEQLFLELNGKVVSVDILSLEKDLDDLIKKMKGQLHY